jgi:hypothetical protein
MLYLLLQRVQKASKTVSVQWPQLPVVRKHGRDRAPHTCARGAGLVHAGLYRLLRPSREHLAANHILPSSGSLELGSREFFRLLSITALGVASMFVPFRIAKKGNVGVFPFRPI